MEIQDLKKTDIRVQRNEINELYTQETQKQLLYTKQKHSEYARPLAYKLQGAMQAFVRMGSHQRV